jgi:hypothetical protein
MNNASSLDVSRTVLPVPSPHSSAKRPRSSFFHEDLKARAVPQKHLAACAPPAHEQEQIPVETILAQLLLHDPDQTVGTLAQIRRAAVGPHADRRGNMIIAAAAGFGSRLPASVQTGISSLASASCMIRGILAPRVIVQLPHSLGSRAQALARFFRRPPPRTRRPRRHLLRLADLHRGRHESLRTSREITPVESIPRRWRQPSSCVLSCRPSGSAHSS